MMSQSAEPELCELSNNDLGAEGVLEGTDSSGV